MPRIQHKRGTSANLASVNPTPLAGELVWDSTENAIKIGDGATAWSSLAYVTATPRTHTHSADAITSGTVAYARLPVGSTTSTVCAGDDARLSDARTPTAHKSTHATGGSDALTPGDIGAAPAASPAITGNATFEASSGVPVTITNTGTGNSFVVNDASGDTTPFVVAADGTVGILTPTPTHCLHVSHSDTNIAHFERRVPESPTSGQGQSLQIVTGSNGGATSGTLLIHQSYSADTAARVSRNQIRMYDAGISIEDGAGGDVVAFNTSTLASAFSGVITVPAGSAGAPSIISTTGTSDTGQWFPAADTIAWSTAGSERLRAKSNGVIRYVPLSADPASGETGDVYFNSTLNKLRVYNGSRWVSLHGAAWDISTARYVQSFSVQAQETAPQSLFFKPDGTKFYVLGSTGDDVNQYDLAVPWDILTATYIQNFSVVSQDNVPQGLFFRADGLKMFMVGSQTDAVYEYTLSTAWNLSTATYSLNSFSVAAAETQPTGVFFKPDGTKMFTVGVIDDYVDQYDLSAAWDITSATFSQSYLVSGEETNPHDLCFSPDGTRFFIVGDSGDGVDEYILGTAWDLSGTVTHAQFRSFSGEEDTLRGLAFSPDGTRLYLIGATNDTVIQYFLN